jgi:hypothetical protein
LETAANKIGRITTPGSQPMKLEDLTPEECEAVLAARAKAAPPRDEVFAPKPAPRRGLPKS